MSALPTCSLFQAIQQLATRKSGIKIHTVETFLFAVTIFVLSVFMLELTASMIALTPQIFFRQFFFLLDYVIITVSLVLEVVFHVIGDDAIYEYVAGLLVVSRIWRFVRIGHGIVEILPMKLRIENLLTC
jgi:hypothetical protein